jgi:hypothetical protein
VLRDDVFTGALSYGRDALKACVEPGSSGRQYRRLAEAFPHERSEYLKSGFDVSVQACARNLTNRLSVRTCFASFLPCCFFARLQLQPFSRE